MRKTTSALLISAAVLSAATVHADEGDACGQGDRFEEFSGPLRELAKRRIEWVSSLFKRERPAVRVQILGFNDFHGQLTDGRRVSSRPVGGAAVMASYLRDEQTRFAGDTLIVHAGDHVGASPPESALLQDEPSISFLNLLGNRQCTRQAQFNPLCNLVGTLGNHEFDEGIGELKRMIFGGNHANGPFLEPQWSGAKFPYVSSNVIADDTGETLLRPYVVKEAGGVLIGVIGAVLEATPTIVTPEGVEGVNFIDEADAINQQVQKLKKLGVETFVVTIHQGGFQASYTGPTNADANGPGGEIANIVQRLDSAVDVVISGHAHSFTNALMPNASGHPILVTQAFSASTAYADIELTIDRVTRDVVTKSASIVTTYGDVAPGTSPAADVAALVQQAKDRTGPLVNRVVGDASVAVTRTQSAAGESALGNLIADSQRAEAAADIALMNPGGIRADLDAGPITWGELFTIQPFGNTLVSMDLTGAQVLRVLEQQWTATSTRFLQISGLSYTWNGSQPIGSRVVSASVGGTPIDPTHTYRVVANNFIAGGGDGFTVLTEGTNVVGGAVDLDALIEYVTGLGGPVTTVVEGRIAKQ